MLLGDHLEDLKELHLGDPAIMVLVDRIEKFLNFIVIDLAILAHLFKDVVQKLADFTCFKSVALVDIVLTEDSVDGLSQLSICVGHF